jgi:parvulin-like peptidyl-prolyl isomerase
MAVIVNGEKIEDKQINQEAENLRPEYERTFKEMDPVLREAQLLEWSKENVIERELIRQKAQEEIPKISDKKVEKAYKDLQKQYGGKERFAKQFEIDKNKDGEIKSEIELRLRVDELMERITHDVEVPTEEELRAFYEEHSEDFTVPEQVRASHIVKTPHSPEDRDRVMEAMSTAKSQLDKGAPFEQVALSFSECPGDEIDLGYFSRGQMVQRFENVVFNMDVDQTSDIFETEFGYHIAKVYDKRPPRLLPFEEVKKNIAEKLLEEKKKKAIEDYIDELKDEATIEEV